MLILSFTQFPMLSSKANLIASYYKIRFNSSERKHLIHKILQNKGDIWYKKFQKNTLIQNFQKHFCVFLKIEKNYFGKFALTLKIYNIQDTHMHVYM